MMDMFHPRCESCGKPADLRLLHDGSTWCLACDHAARNQGYDIAAAELIDRPLQRPGGTP